MAVKAPRDELGDLDIESHNLIRTRRIGFDKGRAAFRIGGPAEFLMRRGRNVADIGANIQKLTNKASRAKIQPQICRLSTLREIIDSKLPSDLLRRQAKDVFSNLLQKCSRIRDVIGNQRFCSHLRAETNRQAAFMSMSEYLRSGV